MSKKKYEIQKIILPTVFVEGYILEKIVRRFSKKSGAIYVPERWIGKEFKVILIPKEIAKESNLFEPEELKL